MLIGDVVIEPVYTSYGVLVRYKCRQSRYRYGHLRVLKGNITRSNNLTIRLTAQVLIEDIKWLHCTVCSVRSVLNYCAIKQLFLCMICFSAIVLSLYYEGDQIDI